MVAGAAFSVRAPSRAASAAITGLRKRTSGAVHSAWVENYTRPSQVRRSHLSYVLYDAFLGFGDRSFTIPLAVLFAETQAGQPTQIPY